MGRYTPAALVWVGVVAAAAVAAAALSLHSRSLTTNELLAFALFGSCAAIAHVFPIKSASDGASYRLTNVFIVAGAVILPLDLISPLAVLAITPESWLRRRRPGVWTRWVFNVSQTALAAYAAAAWVRWMGSQQFGDLRDLSVLLGAAALFTVGQAILVGLVIALNSRIPITRVDTFTLPALLGDSLTALLGILVAGLWKANPVLLLLIPPLLIIAHRMTRTAHLAHLAQVDSKTGLYNSRYFERALDEELAHSLRVGRPLALLFADIDLLRHVNNQHGHLAGDRVLRDISTLLARSLRKGDIIARFGGEEFVVLLPGTEAEEAAYLAERLRSTVESHRTVLEDGTSLRCTISVGIATCPGNATDLARLLEQADRAMYRAKQTRNAVARAQPQPPVPPVTDRGPAKPEAPKLRPASAPRSPLAPLLLWGTIAAGMLAIAASIWETYRTAGWLLLAPFVALAVAAEFLKVQVYEANRQRISLSFTIAATMAAVTVYPAGAPLVSLLAGTVHVVAMLGRQPLGKMLFNLTNPTLAAASAAAVYVLVEPAGGSLDIWGLTAALLAVLAFYFANVGIISLMISLHAGRPLVDVVRESAWFGPTNILLGLTGAFVGGAHAQLGPVGVIMFVVPLLVMRFTLTFYAQRSQRTIETLQAAKAEVEQAHREKEELLRQLIDTVASIIDAQDNSVSGHSRRVARYALALGRELGLPPDQLALLHTAGLFHDLGKVAVPEAILHKPTGLTPEEYELVKQHAAIGERILAETPQLAKVARMVGEHHERYDGTGYPNRQEAGATSIGGRILVVADALESMLADRPYSSARRLEGAVAELDRCAGTQFDPDVVAALHRLVASEGAELFTGPADRPEPGPVQVGEAAAGQPAAPAALPLAS